MPTNANPQDPYSAYSCPEESTETQETAANQGSISKALAREPEYVKALKKTQSYNPATGRMTYMGSDTPGAFSVGYKPPSSAPATGDRPWTRDPAYLAMAADKQKEFDALMDEMEGYQKQSRAAGYQTIDQSIGQATDFWEPWYQKQVEFEDKWGFMKPTTESRDESGALNKYQTLAGSYYYLKPGQYARETGPDGKDIYYYKDPSGVTAGIFQSDKPPEGMYDEEDEWKYGVSETKANPKTAWDETSSYYKYSEMPGLGKLDEATQNTVSPYITQANEIQTQMKELQSMRPDERVRKEIETGKSLTGYVAQLQKIQKAMDDALSGTEMSGQGLKFDPVTGKRIGNAELSYQKENEAYRQLQSQIAQPWMTNPTQQQWGNSMALDLLSSMMGYPLMGGGQPKTVNPTDWASTQPIGKNWWWGGPNQPYFAPQEPTPQNTGGQMKCEGGSYDIMCAPYTGGWTPPQGCEWDRSCPGEGSVLRPPRGCEWDRSGGYQGCTAHRMCTGEETPYICDCEGASYNPSCVGYGFIPQGCEWDRSCPGEGSVLRPPRGCEWDRSCPGEDSVLRGCEWHSINCPAYSWTPPQGCEWQGPVINDPNKGCYTGFSINCPEYRWTPPQGCEWDRSCPGEGSVLRPPRGCWSDKQLCLGYGGDLACWQDATGCGAGYFPNGTVNECEAAGYSSGYIPAGFGPIESYWPEYANLSQWDWNNYTNTPEGQQSLARSNNTLNEYYNWLTQQDGRSRGLTPYPGSNQWWNDLKAAESWKLAQNGVAAQ